VQNLVPGSRVSLQLGQLNAEVWFAPQCAQNFASSGMSCLQAIQALDCGCILLPHSEQNLLLAKTCEAQCGQLTFVTVFD
jgi:hypothetical protein